MDNDTNTGTAATSTGLLTCPFCGAVPEFYDGNYRVRHTTQCYLYDGTEYHWIVGVREAVAWDHRHANDQAQLRTK